VFQLFILTSIFMLNCASREFAEILLPVLGYQIKKYPQLSDSIVLHGQKKQGKKQEHTQIIQQLFEKSNSTSQFIRHLREHNIECYYRNNILSGVLIGSRKHRFKKLGINLELLFLKDTIHGRYKELSARKEKEHNRTKER